MSADHIDYSARKGFPAAYCDLLHFNRLVIFFGWGRFFQIVLYRRTDKIRKRGMGVDRALPSLFPTITNY